MNHRPAWPSFIVLGARKAGTTSLYSLLASEPSIYLPDTKELAYFSCKRFSPGEISWPSFAFSEEAYRAHYSMIKPGQIAGEISSLYFHHRPALEEIADVGFRPKLILVLRNPIERAFSEYRYLRGNGKE